MTNEQQGSPEYQKIANRYKLEDDIIHDTETGLMFTTETWGGTWSEKPFEPHEPSGTIWTEVLDGYNGKHAAKTLEPRKLSWSRVDNKYADVDPFQNESLTLKGTEAGKYSDWRIPDLWELLVLHRNFDWITKASRAIDLNLTIEGRDFWTSTLERTGDDGSVVGKRAYLVSGDVNQNWDRFGNDTGERLGEKGYDLAYGAYGSKTTMYPQKYPRKILAETSRGAQVRLVRGAEKMKHDH